jgi:cobalamin biosynthesis Mg chelatase CobN
MPLKLTGKFHQPEPDPSKTKELLDSIVDRARRLKALVEKDAEKATEIQTEINEIDNALDTILFDLENP